MTIRRPIPMLALLALALLPAVPAHALKVVTWNLWQYPTSLLTTRQPHMRTVMAGLDPDIVMVQELDNGNGTAARDTFLNVLRASLPGRVWKTNNYFASTEAAFYWDSLKCEMSNFGSIATGGPRPVLVGVVKPRGYLTKEGWFRLYNFHFKAGNTTADANTRAAECASLRTTLNNVVLTNIGPNFMIGGDSNFYTAAEAAYISLTESQADNDGRCDDPLDMPGNWHINVNYAIHCTQCPCNTTGCLPGFSGGGLDDRFDLLMTSTTMQDGAGLDLIPYADGGYFAYGNDGFHFNANIDDFTNFAVGATIATALRNASDHIPVAAIVRLASRVSAASALPFGSVLVGATAQQTLTVANPASAPADGLTYSLTAPGGFTAPAGTFEAVAGAAGNDHALGMDTATRGAKAGTLTVASDAPDSLAKPVQLSGTVLSHAVSSLDSASVVTADLLDLGAATSGGFADGAVRVHARGWDALTARLAVNAADITGGAGRFTLVGTFTPALLGATGRTWNVHFDDAGATTDSTYEATLTFTCADEALPGAAAADPLVVTLRARPLPGAGGVDDGVRALRFDVPRPNPFRGATEFAFELPAAAPVTLDVFDLSGRRVARLAAGEFSAGAHQVTWNGLDDAGVPVRAGLYFARFGTPGLARTTRLVRLP